MKTLIRLGLFVTIFFTISFGIFLLWRQEVERDKKAIKAYELIKSAHYEKGYNDAKDECMRELRATHLYLEN